MALSTRILLGLCAGAVTGVLVNVLTGGGEAVQRFVALVSEPLGKMWLNALIMIVVPLILSTLSLGVAGLGDLRRVGRIGLFTMGCFLCLTALSSLLGLAAMALLHPGEQLDPTVREQLLQSYRGQTPQAAELTSNAFGIDVLVRIVPRNPLQAAAQGDMLAVIFFSLMVGIALLLLPRDKGGPMLRFLESLGHVTMAILDLVMKLAPLGVFALIFSTTARFGYTLLASLLQYALTVAGSLLLFLVVVYPLLLALVAHRNPLAFFRKARLPLVTAFSTSSSSATLPTTLRVAEQELGIPRQVGGFVLPLGATMNMNGTALFEGATVLFLAQVFGVELSLTSQLIVVLMSVLIAIGSAGIPAGSIPLLMAVLGMVGVPMEGIAIVLGIDRLLDMCRTAVNVSGDLVTAAIVARLDPAAPAASPYGTASPPGPPLSPPGAPPRS